MEHSIPILPIVYQRPEDLVLSVLHVEPVITLNVLKQAVVNADRWRLAFSVIGESHWVRVEHDGVLVLNEVLACVRMPEDLCVHRQTFSGRDDHTYRDENYGVAVWFENDEIPPPPSQEDFIEVAFPSIHGRTPVTRVAWRFVQNGLRWTSLHAYPMPGGVTVVRSASQMTWH